MLILATVAGLAATRVDVARVLRSAIEASMRGGIGDVAGI